MPAHLLVWARLRSVSADSVAYVTAEGALNKRLCHFTDPGAGVWWRKNGKDASGKAQGTVEGPQGSVLPLDIASERRKALAEGPRQKGPHRQAPAPGAPT